MTKTFNFICTPDIIYDKLVSLNGKRSHRIFYSILKVGCITKTCLSEECGYDKKGMNIAINSLIEIGLISKFRNSDGIVIYFINGSILSKMKIICGDCKYGKIKSKKIYDKIVRYIECLRSKPRFCIKNTFREYYNAYKVISVDFKDVSWDDNIKGKKIKEEENILEQNSDKWNSIKFNKFVVTLYYEFFEDVIITNNFKRNIHMKVKVLCKTFYELIGNGWRKALRCYLYTELINAKNQNRGLNWDYTTNLRYIKKNIEKIGIEFKKIKHCKIKNIQCKYMKVDGCSLIKDGIGCSLKIVNYMKRKYN